MDTITDLIEELKKRNPPADEATIRFLEQKRAELGDEITSDFVDLTADFAINSLSKLYGVNTTISDGYIIKISSTVKSFLDNKGWKYSERKDTSNRENKSIISCEVFFMNLSLKASIILDYFNKNCRVLVQLPINPERINSAYDYLLHDTLMHINSYMSYGSYVYDTASKSISYKYTFLIENGILQNELNQVMVEAVISAHNNLNRIEKFCTGNFSIEEKIEILKKMNALVNMIDK